MDATAKDGLAGILDAQTLKASQIVQSVLAYDLLMQTVALKDLTEALGGARLDVTDFITQAALICPDILAEFTLEGSFQALDVMKRILYNIGPETRSVKKGKDSDKNYRLRCYTKATQNVVDVLEKFDYSSIEDPNMPAAEAANFNAAYVAKFGNKLKGQRAGQTNHNVGMFVISTFKNEHAPTKAPVVEDH